jgi:hypothetical protein
MRRSPGRARFLISALLLIVLFVALFVLARQATAPSNGGAAPTSGFTIDPRIVENLTRLPKATPLAGQAANDMAGLRALVDACPAYDDGRRKQMIDQINLIINPAQLPRELIIALGPNPHTRLLFAIGTVTANRWQLDNKPSDSCLIPIGNRINQLLVAAGEPPLPVFDGG